MSFYFDDQSSDTIVAIVSWLKKSSGKANLCESVPVLEREFTRRCVESLWKVSPFIRVLPSIPKPTYRSLFAIRLASWVTSCLTWRMKIVMLEEIDESFSSHKEWVGVNSLGRD